MYTRAATHWHSTHLDGKQILWINGDEGYGPAICSVRDPDRGEPAIRLIRSDWAPEPLEDESPGLIVYGRYKGDRPSFDEFRALAPQYAYLVDGIEEGRGLTDDGLRTSAQLLGARGGAAGRGKSKRRSSTLTSKTARALAAKRAPSSQRRNVDYAELGRKGAAAKKAKRS